MRRAEAAHLRTGDIDFAGRVLMVRGGKGCKDRPIPLLDTLQTEMQTYCATMRREDLVFGLKDVSVSALVSIWAHKAGIPHIHAHAYRHFFGTELAWKGASARAIMILMGHKSMQTSQRYIDLVADDLRSAIDRLTEPHMRPEVMDTGKARQAPNLRCPGTHDSPCDHPGLKGVRGGQPGVLLRLAVGYTPEYAWNS
jgi:integrase